MENRSDLASRTEKCRRNRADIVALVVVLAITATFAVHLFSLNRSDPRRRWNGLPHDRNGHYEYGMNMGLALRECNPGRFFDALSAGKVWPPVHGLLVAGVVAAAGPDFRLAVLPSLTGWVLTVVFGFLSARRLLPNSGAGILAGALTATLTAASPAHRMYATDVMLESLGAGLTMLALYLYLRAVATPDEPRRWTALAVALIVLFFEKYNYWSLLVLALLGDQLICEWPRNRGWLRAMGGWPWRAWLKRQWREPLNYLFAGFVAAVIAIQMHGPTFLDLAGRRVSLYPPKNLATMAYAVLFVRAILAIRKRRPDIMAWLGIPGRRLFWIVLAPIAVSFLLPGRLTSFLWYGSPLNYGSETRMTLGGAASYYIGALIREYHPAAWCTVLVLALAAAAVVLHRHLHRGWLAAALLLVLSFAILLLHPNQQSRFLHSWIPALWVLAGAGAGALLYHESLNILGRLRPLISAALVLALILAIGPRWRGPGFVVPSGGSSLSTLDISDAYLPYLKGFRRTAIFMASPVEAFNAWTYREYFRRSQGMVDTTWWKRLTPAGDVPSRLPEWLAANGCDSVVTITFSPGSPHYNRGCEQQVTDAVAEAMPQQSDFTLLYRADLEAHKCAVTVWRRR
jgi:hypothetical protein